LAPFAGLVTMLRTGIDSRILRLDSSVLPPGSIGLIAVR
jgi:hypothetical protein